MHKEVFIMNYEYVHIKATNHKRKMDFLLCDLAKSVEKTYNTYSKFCDDVYVYDKKDVCAHFINIVKDMLISTKVIFGELEQYHPFSLKTEKKNILHQAKSMVATVKKSTQSPNVAKEKMLEESKHLLEEFKNNMVYGCGRLQRSINTLGEHNFEQFVG